MSGSAEGRTDAPAKKAREPRKKDVWLIRGYTDLDGNAYVAGDKVSVPMSEAIRLVEQLKAAQYGPLG